ncbi:hypothetical protein [Marinobacter sp. ATCH36]|uniref:hypothetical protein n=1 Tax=Marinobacter sp. ATCH36 TaxID=2945106 RepID=UPI002022799F|nr:hypothetical protein [Marinobacter sp. ATCH36]MCL7944061.1 hypothetical protein [Marinobacter sp. ATCH36]
MSDMKSDTQHAAPQRQESAQQALSRTITTPECLSASVLTICQNVDQSQIAELVSELKRQSAAINSDDLSRAEGMLTAQAHTLDGLFAKLTSDALTSGDLDRLERYMKLALKAQSQARTTLQTLVELKAPKRVAFFQQANIGNQVQVNNEGQRARTRKKRKAPNKLLEADHGERLDTRAAGKTGGVDPAMATVEKQHRPHKR